MYIGDFKPLQATILPENATHKDLVWESSDPTIADVQNGIVLAYKEGTALITASATDKSGTTTSCRVTSSKVTYAVNQLVMRILVQIWAFYNDAF